MEIRKIQRSGSMHYLYLPTAWCKKHRITADSTVTLEQDASGRMTISAQASSKKAKEIELKIKEDDPRIIQKVIMACYINPAKAFRIDLEKDLDMMKLLQQKKLIQMEMIEMEDKSIRCDSNIMVENPEALLRTMVHKTRNLLQLMATSYDQDLVNRYEDEIDKAKTLIDKAIIGTFTFSRMTNLSTIDLHYLSMVSRNLERLVDHLIRIDPKETAFFRNVMRVIDLLRDMVDTVAQHKGVSIEEALGFIRASLKLPKPEISNLKGYDMARIRRSCIEISEVFIDWAVTRQVEKA
ncbi:hypothetical protein COY28_05655 [Candidatus Woesearchaeota archaeon CG_4_10_14_0_2_um_filter_57_5]|nr:MAG: hypothetical protein COV94_05910 [Candidatus Woesearchaeota archaeon CG11_big_fil_rev_8_21_14_0_20_57_5]PIZ50179.1 MAG: hypothetical protein COY28_05655 [Candidatus Woesearchaeota archaeon CG_4_10_14_0_2_um_filter_57_5]